MNFKFRILNFESISNDLTTSPKRGASVSNILNLEFNHLFKIENLKLKITNSGGIC